MSAVSRILMEYQARGLQSLTNKTRGVFLFWCITPFPEKVVKRLGEAGALRIRKNPRNVQLSCHVGHTRTVERFLARQRDAQMVQRLTDVGGSCDEVFLFKGHAGKVMQELRRQDIRGWTIS